MVLAVGADRVARRVFSAYYIWELSGHAADDEKRRLDAFRGKDIKNFVGVGRQRPIIEGEDYLLVSEREGLGILHRAEPHVVGGCDDKYPAGAERVGICRTALCVRGDWERTGNANGCRDSGDSVRPDLLHIWPNPELTLIVNVLRSLWKPDSCFSPASRLSRG